MYSPKSDTEVSVLISTSKRNVLTYFDCSRCLFAQYRSHSSIRHPYQYPHQNLVFITHTNTEQLQHCFQINSRVPHVIYLDPIRFILALQAYDNTKTSDHYFKLFPASQRNTALHKINNKSVSYIYSNQYITNVLFHLLPSYD